MSNNQTILCWSLRSKKTGRTTATSAKVCETYEEALAVVEDLQRGWGSADLCTIECRLIEVEKMPKVLGMYDGNGAPIWRA